jgi:hypothetical protein
VVERFPASSANLAEVFARLSKRVDAPHLIRVVHDNKAEGGECEESEEERGIS